MIELWTVLAFAGAYLISWLLMGQTSPTLIRPVEKIEPGPRTPPDETGDWYYDTHSRMYVNERTGKQVPEGVTVCEYGNTETGVRKTDIYEFRTRYHCAHCRTAWSPDGKGECVGCGSTEQVAVPAVPAKQPAPIHL